MRVGILGTRGYPSAYGGFETLVRNLAPYLVADGVDVTVYCREGDRASRRGAPDLDGVHRVFTMGVDGKTTSTLSYGLTSAWHARREQYDAALVVNVANGLFLPVLRRAGIPTAVNVDGIEWARSKWNALGKNMFMQGARMTARYADTIVADNGAIADIWREKFGVESTYIPYGARLLENPASDKVSALDITPGTYVLAVARLVPENNIELLLDAVDRLDEQVPVVIVGSAVEETPLVARLQQLTADRPDFHWLGHVHDQELLDQLWGHAAVYYYGTTVGGTGPALLQGLGSGSPVIAFDSAQNREVFDGSQHLVPPNDLDALTARLSDVLTKPELRSELSALGTSIVRDRYQWGIVCGQYAAALRSLADGPQVGRKSRADAILDR